jgi:hypothetical protein
VRSAPGGGYQLQTKPYASIKGLGELRSNSSKEVFNRNHDIEATKKAFKPIGEWQTYTVILQGAKGAVFLDGQRICTAAGLQFTKAGAIGLQGKYGHLQFRDIRIKELPTNER